MTPGFGVISERFERKNIVRWEGDDGKVYLSKMNLALMAKMFGGNIAKVMGKKVVRDEEEILRDLLK